MSIQNFIECRIANFKTWYMRYLIRSNVHSYNTVMDIGSGNTKVNFVEWKELYRVDPMIIPQSGHDIVGTWRDAINRLTTMNVDCVFLMDVVEHLPKEDAANLLKLTQMHTKQIVVFTPFGFMPQEDGIWNSHRSGWVRNDFGEGWKVWILKNFHTTDFRGNKLEKPYSAILAIYHNPYN